jgi:hypothetical protein
VYTPYAFFVFRDSGASAADTQGIAFLSVAALVAAVAATTRDLDRLRRRLLAATGVGLLGLPAARLATGGLGWAEGWQLGIAAVPCVDLALMIIGAASLWIARGRRAPASAASNAHESAKPEPQTT